VVFPPPCPRRWNDHTRQDFGYVLVRDCHHSSGMRFRKSTTVWYHVSLATHQQRDAFKIAATARFCEHVLRRACEESGWRADTIVVRPHTVHLLLEVPRLVSKRTVVSRLKRASRRVIHEKPVCRVGKRLFATGHWCAALTGSASVATIRRQLVRGLNVTTV
jgi:REP element-mobilizing transposase RayT